MTLGIEAFLLVLAMCSIVCFFMTLSLRNDAARDWRRARRERQHTEELRDSFVRRVEGSNERIEKQYEAVMRWAQATHRTFTGTTKREDPPS